ncbi:NUDIX hydrolase [Bacillus niameyensis]|uniref:NUDIX hydrolase n=1 Tax=Bacillus niameyensis TaxID=1522308 RepID=UPI0007828473|nr:NUDIX hydrolase [Bacillus niameyensis]
MDKWFGSAGVCINENNELLMVLQGRREETKTWSIPSGGLEKHETFEECCIREIMEETGYEVRLIEKLFVKKGSYEEINLLFEVHYFLTEVIGGNPVIQDPDQLIYDIDWKSVDEISTLDLSYPEDREFLLNCVQRRWNFDSSIS